MTPFQETFKDAISFNQLRCLMGCFFWPITRRASSGMRLRLDQDLGWCLAVRCEFRGWPSRWRLRGAAVRRPGLPELH